MSFKINYKGTNCRGTTFDYKCGKCDNIQQAVHAAAYDPIVVCEQCDSKCHKITLTAPALDADLHDSMLSHNIGWDADA